MVQSPTRPGALLGMLAAALLMGVPSLAQRTLYASNETSISSITPSGAVSDFASTGLHLPRGLAFGPDKQLYVADVLDNFNGNTLIQKIDAVGHATAFATVAHVAVNIAFDGQGNLYASTFQHSTSVFGSTVMKIAPDGSQSLFASGFDGPQGLAFDAFGNLYVAGYRNNVISKVTPGGVVSTLVTGLTTPFGLAFDRNGDLYVSNVLPGDNTIDKITFSAPGVFGGISVFAGGGTLNRPAALAFDDLDNLYVSNIGGSGNTISRISPNGSQSLFATGLASSQGLVFAPDTPEPGAIGFLVSTILAGRLLFSRRRKP